MRRERDKQRMRNKLQKSKKQLHMKFDSSPRNQGDWQKCDLGESSRASMIMV